MKGSIKGKTSVSVLSRCEEKSGYTLSCRTFPKTDLTILI